MKNTMNDKKDYSIEYRQKMLLPTPNGEITQGETYIKAIAGSVNECIALVDRFIDPKGRAKKIKVGKKKDI